MTDHVIQLRYYNDGAENPTAWRDLDGGGTGAFLQPLVARRLGQARHRVWEIRDTSSFAVDILAAAILTDLTPDWMALPLPDGTYRDATRPWSQQDVVNLLPCFAEANGTRSRMKYATAPGLVTYANVGAGPHRGICDVEGTLYVVSGSTLYRVATDGTGTSLGTIPGTGRVAMSYNQITNGNQLVIGTGSGGYVYNTYAATLTQITDDGFPGFVSCDFLNQYIVGVEPQRRFWFHSELNDALSYNTLDRYQAETSPDRIVGVIASHNEVLVFGERTIEPWVNDPENNAAATAFQLERGSVIERGCAAAASICRLDNSIFFLGNDRIVYRLDGYTPRPISPQAMVSAWRELTDAQVKRAFAFTYEDNGHVIYYLTFPDGQTWGYDVAASASAGHPVWHRRQSFEFDRWRLNTLTKSNGQWIGGDFQTGKLYRVEWGSVYEGCELMPRSLKTGVLHRDGLPVAISGFRLTAATGMPQSTVEAEVAPSISGAAPDGTVGDAISYQYTITPAFPGQQVTLTVNGTLPPGLSLNASGLLAGTLTTSGVYSWTITPSSECAEGTPLADLATISDSLASAILADAPLLYWKLNETSGTNVTDYSGNGYDGTHSGSGMTLSADGVHYTSNAGGTFRSHASGVPAIGDDNGWTMVAVVTLDSGATQGSVDAAIAWISHDLNLGQINAALSLRNSGTTPVHMQLTGKIRGSLDDVTYGAVEAGDFPTATRAIVAARRTPTGTTLKIDVLRNGVVTASYAGAASDTIVGQTELQGFYVGGGQTGYPASYAFIGTIAHVALFGTALSDARLLYYAQKAGLA